MSYWDWLSALITAAGLLALATAAFSPTIAEWWRWAIGVGLTATGYLMHRSTWMEDTELGVRKRCNIRAPGCHGWYDMNHRVEKNKKRRMQGYSPMRHDGCDNMQCQNHHLKGTGKQC